MDVEVFIAFIEVMKTLFGLREDEVWFKADHIMEEASEFVNFTSDLDIGSGVLLEEGTMLTDLAFQRSKFLGVSVTNTFLFEDVQMLCFTNQLLELLNSFTYFIVKLL